MHTSFTLQNSTLAIFTWHNDAADLQLIQRAVSVVVPINIAVSAMEIWGFDVHKYSGAGAAVAFLSAAWHISVSLRPLVDRQEDIMSVDTNNRLA